MGRWSFLWSELINRKEWSASTRIAEANPPAEGGVYIVQANTATRPKTLRRANGNDDLGILLIGETTGLAHRIKTLRAAMQLTDGTRPVPHRPGLEYSKGWGYDFGREFAYETLTVRYWITRHHVVLEAALLERYRWHYLDRPPLNSSNGKWRGRARDEDGWIVLPRGL